jgi:hypothetical protein
VASIHSHGWVVLYTLRIQGVEIGTSDLPQFDAHLGVAYGGFLPGPAYELVQDVFRLFAEAAPVGSDGSRDEELINRYFRARDALGLELVDRGGKLISTTAIDISDYSRETGTEAYEVMVYLEDPECWVEHAP